MPNNLVVVILDSLRYDSWLAAAPRDLARIGDVQRRWSYASWTAPSHHNLLMGLLPHDSPQHVLASDHYKDDFIRYQTRLDVPGIDFASMLPALWMPSFLRDRLGYSCHAMVSMPVLNPATVLNRGFDSYELMPQHNDLSAMIDKLSFDGDQPRFYLLNTGETHYPYALPHEDPTTWPRVSGVHGVLKRMADAPQEDWSWSTDELKALHDRQVDAVRYLDGVFTRLYDKVPDDTWLIVTSDHGELFGEDGYFGHGPVMHEKVLEVPFVEGRVPR